MADGRARSAASRTTRPFHDERPASDGIDSGQSTARQMLNVGGDQQTEERELRLCIDARQLHGRYRRTGHALSATFRVFVIACVAAVRRLCRSKFGAQFVQRRSSRRAGVFRGRCRGVQFGLRSRH